MTTSRDVRNVVVVIVDALRADRVGAYGSRQGLTPKLEALAEEGTVFENAFACINTTDPSITSIHTGRYPRETVIHHGDLVTQEEKRRVEATEYLPEELENAGFRTLSTGRVMGRWHPRGFSEYSWDSVEQTEMKLSQILKDVHPMVHRVVAGAYNTMVAPFRDGRDENLDYGEDAVSDLLGAIDERQFYGFVHMMDTHAWYDADPDLVDRLLERNDYPDGDLDSFFEEYGESPVVSKLLAPNATGADERAGLARLFARYDATVREADEKLGRLIAGLKEQDRWGNTALLVLSDHGESLDEHGIYFDHHGLYDQTMHVPLVAHVPGTSSGRVEEFVQLHDVGPTVSDLLDVSALEDADGQSLLGYVDESVPAPEPREHVVLEEAHAQRRRGVRTDRYKYIEHVPDDVVADHWGGDPFECGYCKRPHGEEVELYDLLADPEETENVAAEKPDVVETMRETLAEFTRTHSPPATDITEVAYEDEDEVLDRLQELGYR